MGEWGKVKTYVGITKIRTVKVARRTTKARWATKNIGIKIIRRIIKAWCTKEARRGAQSWTVKVNWRIIKAWIIETYWRVEKNWIAKALRWTKEGRRIEITRIAT